VSVLAHSSGHLDEAFLPRAARRTVRNYRLAAVAVESDPPGVTIAELFDSESLIAQWVFQMTGVVVDLSNADKLLHDALDAGGPPALIGYSYRQLLFRLYECERPVLTLDTSQEVGAWVENLEGATAPLAVLKAHYLPPNGSRVHELYAMIRHRSVHQSWVGSPELKDTIAAAGDEEAWLVVDHDASTMDYEWPEAALLRALFGDLEQDGPRRALAKSAGVAQSLARAFMDLTVIAVMTHAEAVGIAPTRFIRQVGSVPTPPHPPTATD
jgi:hypothetical protein